MAFSRFQNSSANFSEIPSDECISDEIVFSDDEKEKEYRMRKSAAAAAAKRPGD